MKQFEKNTRFGWAALMLLGVFSTATVVLAEDKPAETQPAETQPAETQPAETQPAETQPAETQPDEGDSDEPEAKAPDKSVLLDPSHESWSRQAPDVFKVKFQTTKGDVVIEVTRAWAPQGADRFYNLVDNGFYDSCKFFRVIDRFMAQFGINGDPEVSAVWREQRIKDDPNTQSNTRGRVTFAMAGPNTRTSQLFISFGDNRALDGQGFSPFGQVVEGMDVVDRLYSGYGEGAPRGSGPDQGRTQHEGNKYLEADFPYLDGIITAKVVE
jgi:cyclophilin family peptidyl-prolyl cis-trans isomerase